MTTYTTDYSELTGLTKTLTALSDCKTWLDSNSESGFTRVVKSTETWIVTEKSKRPIPTDPDKERLSFIKGIVFALEFQGISGFPATVLAESIYDSTMGRIDPEIYTALFKTN